MANCNSSTNACYVWLNCVHGLKDENEWINKPTSLDCIGFYKLTVSHNSCKMTHLNHSIRHVVAQRDSMAIDPLCGRSEFIELPGHIC